MTLRPFILSAQIRADAPLADPVRAAAIVTLADRVQLDLLLLGEVTATGTGSAFEPLITAAWLASRAGGVGLVASVSALHAEPFHIARSLSALDFLTRGRCGWHPTTAGIDWLRYGSVGQVADGEIAAKAEDFIAATRSLWDGWDADALIIDTQSGHYLHAERVRRGDHRGAYHRVLGPLNAARPPQGHPLLLQSDIDRCSADVAADVRIVSRGSTPPQDGSKRLVRCGADECTKIYVAELAQQWRDGFIDGLHLESADPLTDFKCFGAEVLPRLELSGIMRPVQRTGLLRKQFGLPIPSTSAAAAAPSIQS